MGIGIGANWEEAAAFLRKHVSERLPSQQSAEAEDHQEAKPASESPAAEVAVNRTLDLIFVQTACEAGIVAGQKLNQHWTHDTMLSVVVRLRAALSEIAKLRADMKEKP